MSSNTSESETRKDRGVLCAKCEHLSPWGGDHCERCGAALYMSCRNCHQRQERVRTRCTHCGARLRRHSVEWLRSRPARAMLVSAVIALVFAAILILSGG